jgi:GAF domain-containing protein
MGAVMTDKADTDAVDVTGLLLDTETLEGFLQSMAQAAIQRVPGTAGCGITLERAGRPLTVASVGSGALELDEAQYGQDDGPCLQALRTGHEVSVPDLADEKRWWPYPAFAVAQGVRSSLSLPIAAHTHTAGALNLYAAGPHAFAETDLGALRALADRATGGIALAQRIADAQEIAADLNTALRSRAVIDQAIGVIMGQQRCGREEAFGLLRAASQDRNIKLRDLCADMISRFTDTGKDPGDSPGLRQRS